MADPVACNSSLDFIPWLISALGWIVINSQNNQREKRKELRSRVDAVKKAIDDIEAEAIDYHTVGATPVKSARLKKALGRVSRELRFIEHLGVATASRTIRMAALRNAITISNFDSNNYAQLNPGDNLLSGIELAAENLATGIESGYSDKYHKRSFWKLSSTRR